MFKKGDTLIEVMLAIGIFSMVAISVVAVISSSTAGAETSLETTLAREEIDTQAESLRFIQSAAAADRTSADDRFYKIWQEISSVAVDVSNSSKDYSYVLQYAPTSCSDVYKSFSDKKYTPFIINPRALGSYAAGNTAIEDVFVKYDSKLLQPTDTYPHLIYGNSLKNSDSATLISDTSSDSLFRAAGIFIVAVKDPKTTQIISGSDSSVSGRASAYYDFYIRTCWYGLDADTASNISTVIRLYNIDVVEQNDITNDSDYTSDMKTIRFSANTGTFTTGPIKVSSCPQKGLYCKFPTEEPTRAYADFKGWSTSSTATEAQFSPGELFDVSTVGKTTFYAVWAKYPELTFDGNGGTFLVDDTTKSSNKVQCTSRDYCTIPNTESTKPGRSGYEFLGWSTSKTATTATYQPGDVIDLNRVSARTLYAVWYERNETITVKLTWPTSVGPDFDSHVEGQKSDGTYFHAFYNNLVGSDTSGLIIAELEKDCTGSCREENFTINTLGGRNYYYYVHNFSGRNSGTSITDATVTVSGPYIGTHTFKASDATGSGAYWNVFAYKDGRIVSKQTRTSLPLTNY